MKTLSASATVTINAIATKKKMNGERVYNFAAGDPVLNNHHSIINRAIRQTEKKFCPYPPVEGIPELRSLVAEWVNITCLTQYAKENVLVTCGGKFALFAIVYALLQSNEEVLIPAPYWVSYPDIVKMAGGTPKVVPTRPENGWKITAQDLLQHITKNSKMLIFNNACNPTGVLYTQQEINDILAIAKKFGLIVISDEVYSGLVYEEPGFISCGAFPEHRERVLIVQSCSKNFGMTGWRVGFVLGPEDVIKRLAILQSQSTTGVSVISQWGAVGALENAEYVLEGDFSSAGYFFAIAALTRSTITLKNLNPHSMQADRKFLNILAQMGNEVSVSDHGITIIGKQILPQLLDMEDCPDQVQTMAVLAAFAKGVTKISGVRSLRLKETERVEALKNELAKMGIKTEDTHDTLTIYGGAPHAAIIDTYGDHRMAMAFAVAGTKLPGMKIRHPEVVNKTFPTFWDKLRSL